MFAGVHLVVHDRWDRLSPQELDPEMSNPVLDSCKGSFSPCSPCGFPGMHGWRFCTYIWHCMHMIGYCIYIVYYISNMYEYNINA